MTENQDIIRQRKLRVVLDIDVRAMTGEELAECGLEEFEDEPGDGSDDGLSEYVARDIADLLPFGIEQGQDEMFAGSSVFARIEKVAVSSASWHDEDPTHG